MRHGMVGRRGGDRKQEQRLGDREVAPQHGHVADVVQALRRAGFAAAPQRLLIAALPGLRQAEIRGGLLQVGIHGQRLEEGPFRDGIVPTNEL